VLFRSLQLFANPADGFGKGLRFVGDINLSGEIPLDWGFENERVYINNVMHPANNIEPNLRFVYGDSSLIESDIPELRPILSSSIDDSVETSFFRYSFKIINLDTLVFTGYSKFKLFKSISADEAWYIYYWEDAASEEQFEKTWTNLKAKNQ